MSAEDSPSRPRRAEHSPAPVVTGTEALAWLAESGEAESVAVELHRRSRRRARRWAGATAVLIIGLGAGVVMWRSRPATTPTVREAVMANTSVVASPETRTLPDGSTVELNTGARIAVEFGGTLRRVVLQAGEAHFQVAKDAARDFVVCVDGVAVRAIGTAFAVQRNGSQVDVIVTEGRVAVERTKEGAAPPAARGLAPSADTLAFLDAGYRAVVPLAADATAVPPVIAVTPAETSARLAWRVPRLEFSGAPLSEAIPMFNRHCETRLVLDPELGRLQMSGVLRADDVDSLLLLLKNEFGIEAERSGGELHLHQARAEKNRTR